MRFKRISTDTIRCIVSEEELEANGLQVDDFLANDGKTEDFLRKMVALAEQEVGFKVQGGPMTIQVNVLADNQLCLTLSEKQGGNLMELLEGLRSAMGNLSEVVSAKTKEKLENSPLFQPVRQSDQEKKEDEVPISYGDFLLKFESLRNLQLFCAGIELEIEENMNFSSSMYRLEEEDSYYLAIYRGKNMDDRQLCKVLSASIEFIQAIRLESFQLAYVKEHGRCVIADHAISQMQSLYCH